MDKGMEGELVRCRVGKVSKYDPTACTACVIFPDKDGMVSQPFPVLYANSRKNRVEAHLDPGEHVVCLCLGNGIEAGFVLGAFYDRKNPPAIGEQDKWAMRFEDGTEFAYDRKEHILTLDVKGDVSLKSEGNVTVEAAGSVHILGAEGVAIVAGSGGATLEGNFSMRGSLRVDGSIDATGSIIDGGTNTNHHSH